MRISHVTPRYFPAISGSEFYMQQLSEIFQRRNHKVKVFCSNAVDFYSFGSSKGKKNKEKQSKINNVNILRYPISYFPGISLFFNNIYTYYKKILRKINSWHKFPINYLNILINGPFTPKLFLQMIRDQTEIIHSTPMPFATNLFALLVGKLKKIPTICTPFYHFMNPRYHDPTYVKFLNKFDKIFTCSQKESIYLIKHGLLRDKINHIHMGIDAKKFLKGNPKKFRTQFDIAEEQKLILFCGYKNFEKGAITLLLAIEHVIKRYPNCIFIFIGPSTTAFNRIKKKLGSLRDNIINLGIVPYYSKVKINAFAAHDIYVMPSRSDAYGIAFLEAWINKKPVIGANIGATPEIINNETDGLLVPFHSPSKLSKAICRLLNNEREAQKLGENGYQKIKNFSWDKIATKIERIYQELIQN